MACLTDLPPEIVLSILIHLSTSHLQTFLTSQSTCKAFQLLAQDILAHPPAPPEQPDRPRLPNPLLAHSFAPLFSSAHSFTPAERKAARWYLSLNGDATLPFRRLPWAADACAREKHLRPGASWRGLSVTFGVGAPVTRLEVVKNYSSGSGTADGRDHVQFLEVEVAGGGGRDFLTMGGLYDLLLCGGAVGDEGAVTFRGETGSWELLLGARLRSWELLAEYECFVVGDEELVDEGPGAAGSAILLVRAGTVDGEDQDRRFWELEEEEEKEEGGDGWVPEVLGDMPRIRLGST